MEAGSRVRREHALRLDDTSAEPNLTAVRESAELYRLTEREADRVLAQVRAVVKTWREKAQAIGLSRAEQQRMEAAFEHD